MKKHQGATPYRIGTCVVLATVALMGIGFSSFTISTPPVDVDVDVEVGEVTQDGKGISEVGFSAENNYVSNLSYHAIADLVNDTSSVYTNGYLDAKVYIDTSVLKDISPDDNLFVKIAVSYPNAEDVTDLTKFPKIDALTIFPENYTYFTFSAYYSSHSTNKKPVFSFPLKSESEMNFYDLAKLDSYYPVNTSGMMNYQVPLILRFSVSEIPSTFISSNFTYQITYSLTTNGAIA